MTRKGKRVAVSQILMTVILLGIALIALFPLYAIILASLKPGSELMRYGLNVRLDWDMMSINNYLNLFDKQSRYVSWFKNSVGLTLIQMVLTLAITSFVGYGFAMYEFKGKNFLFILVLIIMMIPFEIILLPLYQMMVDFRLIDTYGGVILPSLAAPVAIFFFRQYLSGISRAFLDAGRVDGCTEYGIYLKIIFPIMIPAFGAMAILQGLNSWNAFLWPLIVLRTDDKFTLPIGLSSLISPYGNNYDILIAGSVVSIIPILILFLLFQKSFINGITAGGVKG